MSTLITLALESHAPSMIPTIWYEMWKRTTYCLHRPATGEM